MPATVLPLMKYPLPIIAETGGLEPEFLCLVAHVLIWHTTTQPLRNYLILYSSVLPTPLLVRVQ